MLAHESNFFSNIQDFGYCCERPCLKQINAILCTELGYKTKLIIFKFKDSLMIIYDIYMQCLWISAYQNYIFVKKFAYFGVSFVFSTNLSTVLDFSYQKT